MFEFDKISEQANVINPSDHTNFTRNVLFPFFEELGFDLSNPDHIGEKIQYGANQRELIDYSLIDSKNPLRYRSAVKIANRGPNTSFSDCELAIKNCFELNTTPTKYGLIVDGRTISVYQNDLDGMHSTGISHVKNIDLGNIDPIEDEDVLFELARGDVPRPTQKAARVKPPKPKPVHDDDYEQEDEDDDAPVIWGDSPQKQKPQKSPKKKEKKEVDSTTVKGLFVILFLVGVVSLIGWYVWTNYFKDDTPSDITPTPGPAQSTETQWDDLNLTGETIDQASLRLQHIKITSVLATKFTQGNKIEISLLNTNIPSGAIIKYELICGTNKAYIYDVINSNGEASKYFTIPSTWDRPSIVVVAYMRFDETGEYAQPVEVKKKYGDDGESIITPTGAPKYAMAYSIVTHENESVISYLEKLAKDEANALAKTREKDFAMIETLHDAKGNIKHVPAGFSLYEANITENRNIYPVIFYDASTKKSTFSVVCGYVGRDWIMFESVVFEADTHKWGYDIGSNTKETSIGGNFLSEWVYFNNVNVPTLLADMNLSANSSEAKISFVGPKRKEHKLTDEEKDAINEMLYIYKTYYGNGTTVPDTKWFEVKATVVDMSYLKMPSEVKARYSDEINQISSLTDTITRARAQGNTVSEDDQNKLDAMSRLYKPVDSSIFKRVFNEIKEGEAYAAFDERYETAGSSYYRIFFGYDTTTGTIETGYVPYITIYSNRTVLIPLITVTRDTPDYEKTLIETTISDALYSELVEYFDSTVYEFYK